MSRRIEKINELLKQEISSLILRELDFKRDVIITVTKVETYSDLNKARVGISILPFSKSEQVLKILNAKNSEIQRLLNQKLKMKIVPKIKFKLDSSAEKISRVEQLLKKQ